jgi:import inner membrane translocase subunit TIM21
VTYFLYTEVFALDSKTNHFNYAVNRVKRDSRCTDLLGDGKNITAYGEDSWNKWRRNRSIAYAMSNPFILIHNVYLYFHSSTITTDKRGIEHLIMHFNVSLPLIQGLHKYD